MINRTGIELMAMNDKYQSYWQKAQTTILQCTNLQNLQAIQTQLVGKSSLLAQGFQTLNSLSAVNKKQVGSELNQLKQKLFKLIKQKRELLQTAAFNKQIKNEKLDPTLNGFANPQGNLHPLQQIQNEIEQIFSNLEYVILDGQEIETDEYNFQKLNLDLNHPARINHDTFYIDDNHLLRTHCTNVSARMLEKIPTNCNQGACLSLGTVYRRDDDDATHSHQFQQIDGVMVGPEVSLANLKGTLKYLCTRLFGPDTKINLRPSYFPFTEPSLEVDVSCPYCQQTGCSVCKYNGFIEILGAGMINPTVFAACGKPTTWQGFAFGVGVERIAMIKYHIDDIRRFYNNDLRFLQQF